MNWNSAIVEVLFYIILTGLLVRSVKVKDEEDENFSKITAESLKGVCCLVIFGHHYGQMCREPALSILAHFGYLVLNIFFMISGYGVSYGLENKKNYLDSFLIRRCGKILLCYWLMNGITVIVDYCYYGRINIDSWERGIKIFLMRDAYYTQASWYIMMLFWLYIFFYLAARFFGKHLQVFMLLAVSGIIVYDMIKGMPLWYYNYLYSFNVGIYMANRKKMRRKGGEFFKVFVSFVFFVLLFIISKLDRVADLQGGCHILLNISAVLSSTALALSVMFVMGKIKLESKLLYMFGVLSTSIYVFHTCIMLRGEIQYKMFECVKNWGLCLWISLGITILVSIGIERLKKMKRRSTGEMR